MSGTLNISYINSQAVPTGSAGLVAADSTQVAKAWCNFNAIPLTGTYSQSLSTITVTMTDHGMTTGMIVNLDFTSGSATDAADFVVTVTDANTFTVVGKTSISTSGNVTRNNYIRASYNVASVVDNGIGSYTVNFATPMVDTNYFVSITGEVRGVIGYLYSGAWAGGGVYTTTSAKIIYVQGNGNATSETTSYYVDGSHIGLAVFR